MGVFSFLKKNKAEQIKFQYVTMMNGSTPIFSQFGENIYASDIIQGCIRCVSTAVSKLQPRHIRTDAATGLQNTISSSINYLLKFKPNPLMTTSDFLEQITWMREMKKNVFIYPTYKEIEVKDRYIKREYTGFYPLNPMEVLFLQDSSEKIFIQLYFANGESFILPYSDVIHWRKDFGANEFMGGDENGQPDNKALLKLLSTDDVSLQGMKHAIKSTSGIKGILKLGTLMKPEEQENQRKLFEEKLNHSESGIIPMDMKGEFIPIQLSPQLIDSETARFVVERILNNYGVSLPIYNGDFTEEQYQSFYEKTLESMVISLGRCFSSTLFTKRELEFGNEVIFYNQGLNFTNMVNKIQLVDILSSRGAITDNEMRAIFGYPPFENGNIRKQSLNYINTELADSYQSGKKDVIEENGI